MESYKAKVKKKQDVIEARLYEQKIKRAAEVYGPRLDLLSRSYSEKLALPNLPQDKIDRIKRNLMQISNYQLYLNMGKKKDLEFLDTKLLPHLKNIIHSSSSSSYSSSLALARLKRNFLPQMTKLLKGDFSRNTLEEETKYKEVLEAKARLLKGTAPYSEHAYEKDSADIQKAVLVLEYHLYRREVGAKYLEYVDLLHQRYTTTAHDQTQPQERRKTALSKVDKLEDYRLYLRGTKTHRQYTVDFLKKMEPKLDVLKTEAEYSREVNKARSTYLEGLELYTRQMVGRLNTGVLKPEEVTKYKAHLAKLETYQQYLRREKVHPDGVVFLKTKLVPNLKKTMSNFIYKNELKKVPKEYLVKLTQIMDTIKQEIQASTGSARHAKEDHLLKLTKYHKYLTVPPAKMPQGEVSSFIHNKLLPSLRDIFSNWSERQKKRRRANSEGMDLEHVQDKQTPVETTPKKFRFSQFAIPDSVLVHAPREDHMEATYALCAQIKSMWNATSTDDEAKKTFVKDHPTLL